ncbi:MAG: IS21 family transposase [Proteobacteria bacterium]|nr:IS21 family transposase [Pseudomonadota bacterium]
MRKTKEILRLRFDHAQSNRAIARSCSISHNTVAEYIKRFLNSGLPWPLPENIHDDKLQQALFPEETSQTLTDKPMMPQMQYLHKELRRPGVTLFMLWEEYRQQEPNGYGKSQFYDHYRQWAKKLNPSMRQKHKAGEKVFVDYAGKKPEIVDPKTGEIKEVELFIGVLGASSYTYIEASLSQSLPDWISSHIRMLEFFGAVPSIIVPDNLKSGVTKACRYEPDLNPTYQDLCDHYGLAVIPARKRKPKDKD